MSALEYLTLPGLICKSSKVIIKSRDSPRQSQGLIHFAQQLRAYILLFPDIEPEPLEASEWQAIRSEVVYAEELLKECLEETAKFDKYLSKDARCQVKYKVTYNVKSLPQSVEWHLFYGDTCKSAREELEKIRDWAVKSLEKTPQTYRRLRAAANRSMLPEHDFSSLFSGLTESSGLDFEDQVVQLADNTSSPDLPSEDDTAPGCVSERDVQRRLHVRDVDSQGESEISAFVEQERHGWSASCSSSVRLGATYTHRTTLVY